MTCEACRRQTSKLIIHDSALWCPACVAAASQMDSLSAAVHGDEIDVTIRNGTRVPIRFRSRGELKAWKQANGLVDAVWHVPVPGTDKSPHTTNWASGYDPYTAENVRILLERAFHAPSTPEPDASIHFTPDIHDLTPEEWKKYA